MWDNSCTVHLLFIGGNTDNRPPSSEHFNWSVWIPGVQFQMHARKDLLESVYVCKYPG